MSRKLKVYVAGPYSNGDVAQNVANAIKAGDELLEAGHIPFVPHLTHFWEMQHSHEWGEWLDYDIEWLKECDILLRLPGKSTGAEIEMQVALAHGIPICYSVREVEGF